MEEQAHRRQAQQRSETRALEVRQQTLLLEQQPGHASDVHQQLLYERQMYQSCGMQRAWQIGCWRSSIPKPRH
eukprot:8846642-Prorocentrum_lima.AAC.1